MQNESDIADFQSFATEVLARLDQGIALDWTDIRIYLVVGVATLLGSVIGAYFGSYFRKRGEVAAIRKDLDEITRLQKSIEANISTKTWITQNWWSLKKETYLNLTRALNDISGALWNLLQFGFTAEKSINQNGNVTAPLVAKVDAAMDAYLGLTGVSHMSLSPAAIAIINELSVRAKQIHEQLRNGRMSYDDFLSLREAFNAAYDKIISVARSDLQAPPAG
jgi:hypothetical protein